ncbi:MAG: hypothetical protein ACI9K2_005482, partial [Myxococcota bacterium]
MALIGTGEWDSTVLQDARWRKRLERLDDASVTGAERVRLARKVLRDGNDLAVCLLFHTFRNEDRGTAEHPLRAVLGPMRVRARRILSRPSRLRGRDHREAAAVLRHAPQTRDVALIAARLSEPLPADTRLDLVIAIGAMDDPPADTTLVTALRAEITGDQAELHPHIAQFLRGWSAADATVLLREAVAHHHGHQERWPYLSALLHRDSTCRGLVEAHRDS